MFNFSSLLGKTEEEAISSLKREGIVYILKYNNDRKTVGDTPIVTRVKIEDDVAELTISLFLTDITRKNFPKHLAFIMDGNRRWAVNQNVEKIHGHEKGREAMENVIQHSLDLGVKKISFFAFSSENFKRDEKEKNDIFTVFNSFFSTCLEKYLPLGVYINVIGDLSRLPKKLLSLIKKVNETYPDYTRLQVDIAISYGGQSDILQAAKGFPENGSEEEFTARLKSSQPFPDLVVRTGGERRISNFMLYQIAYSELYFSDTLWPDFSKEELDNILLDYNNRERRFGGK